MHPIVIIVFLFAGIGGAYWLVNNLGTARNAATGTAVSIVAQYGNTIIKVAFVLAVIYAVWVVYQMVNEASMKKKSREGVQKL